MDVLTEKFIAYLQQQDRAPKTIQGYLCDLESFARWFQQSNGEKLTDKKLTPTDAREYRQWLVARTDVIMFRMDDKLNFEPF
jgi:integrase/recombinase XerC